MKVILSLFTTITASGLIAFLALSGCHKVDDKRIPYAPVYIPFTTEGDWNTYGTNGATITNRFIKPKGIPSDYHYTDLAQTGFGGVLLAGSYDNSPRAYDLSCPVECRRDIIISVDEDRAAGVCHTCGSTYDIFNMGGPLSGPAADHGDGLERYNVGPGANGIYMAVTN